LNPQSAKNKGRARTCRRCKENYTPSFPLQKVCSECREFCSTCGKPLGKRYTEKNKSLICKDCVKESVKKIKGRKEWQKEYDLQRAYGISTEQYNKMAKHGCAICGDTKSKLCVDHCHSTGRVRGILCTTCNTGLGMFKDNKQVLEKAIAYLSS
jgi:hypothetical protein